jgi:hypothetical protein
MGSLNLPNIVAHPIPIGFEKFATDARMMSKNDDIRASVATGQGQS